MSGIQWCGEGSGHAFGILVEKVLPLTMGRIDLVLCWEGGDSFTGLEVRDGVVTERDVAFRLVPKK